jgi:hypothetical protein
MPEVHPMSADEQEALAQRMTASLETVMAAAQHAMEAADALEYIDIAALALQGIHVVPWRPPTLSRPVCLRCGRVDQMYQWVATGCVRCRCEIAP